MEINIPVVEKINLKIGGSVYKMESPSAMSTARYTEKVRSLEKKELKIVELTIDYLASLGLPKDRGSELRLNDLIKIVTCLSGDEKKS